MTQKINQGESQSVGIVEYNFAPRNAGEREGCMCGFVTTSPENCNLISVATDEKMTGEAVSFPELKRLLIIFQGNVHKRQRHKM